MPIPWRTGMPGRPDVAVPPRPMPLFHGRRPLKRWRWVGAFSDELMLCAAIAYIGPVPVSWWAVWDRASRTLAEHTVKRIGPVRLEGSSVRIEDGPVTADLLVAEVPGVETISSHGDGGYIWTRKQGGVRVTGDVTVADRAFTLDAPGFVDDSGGYHARRTSWFWSAGVGTTADGRDVAWNLVTGLHDAPAASERTVWIDGEPHEVEPQAFDDLHGVGGLRFSAEATRAHAENALILASDYEQPFGTFSGTLPVAGEITGLGVMERHRAVW
jgi:Protein of unknown function (DUF2804)